jgi:hypothetical protein
MMRSVTFHYGGGSSELFDKESTAHARILAQERLASRRCL